jgi:hypothetical protein
MEDYRALLLSERGGGGRAAAWLDAQSRLETEERAA